MHTFSDILQMFGIKKLIWYQCIPQKRNMLPEPEIQDTPDQLQVLHPTVQTLSTQDLRLRTSPTGLTATSKWIQNKTKMLMTTLSLINWSPIPINH